MKLNLKQTLKVGLAFLSISAFWQLYDFCVPLILRDTYALGDTNSGLVMAMDNIVALFLLPFFGTLSDKCNLRIGKRMPFILFGTAMAVTLILTLPYVISHGSLTVFLVMLALLLLAMGTYRSPAVALMPDVTPKPLRSKGNAIINLMGTLGGIITLLLINVAVIRTPDEAGVLRSDYTYLFYAVAIVMAVCIITLFLTVKERKIALPAEQEAPAASDGPTSTMQKMRPEVKRSLILILCSVSLWFMAYNAVTTAFSKYAMSVWGIGESQAANCVLLGTVGAVISYWPVGIVSSRFGRRKVILFGVAMLVFCFVIGATMQQMSWLAYAMFALVGVGWASINVNSFPMVVEIASGSDTGKYTGYYYTFSMAAQVITPILSGALLEHVGYWTLFPYSAVLACCAFVTMLFVRHGDAKPEAKRGLEALDTED